MIRELDKWNSAAKEVNKIYQSIKALLLSLVVL